MNDIELYTDFLDGRLSEEAEYQFYNQALMNDEFRTYFRLFRNVTRLLKDKSAREAIPAGLDEAVFASLGLKTDDELVGMEEDRERELKDLRKKKGFLWGFFPGILTGIIMILLYVNFFQNHNGDIVTEDNQLQSARLPGRQDHKDSKYKSTIPSVTSFEAKEKIKKYKSDNKFTEPKQFLQDGNISDIPKILTSPYHNIRLIKAGDAFIMPVATSSSYSLESTYPQNVSSREMQPAFTFEFENGALWMLTKEKIPPRSISPFNNVILSALYNINDELKIGVEIRPESFYTEYSGTENDSSLFKYFEQSNFMTYGAKIRYQPYDLGSLKPLIQLGIGFNRGGIALRPMIGAEYYLYRDIAMKAAIEYTGYYFTHQGKLFFASKMGIIYGVSIKF